MNNILNQIKKLPIKKDVINYWRPNPKYTGFPDAKNKNSKIAFYEPIEVDYVKLDDVIKLLEDYKNKNE